MAFNGLDISSELPCKLMRQRIQSFAVFVKVFSCGLEAHGAHTHWSVELTRW